MDHDRTAGIPLVPPTAGSPSARSVSVVIPLVDDRRHARRCVTAWARQACDESELEILLVSPGGQRSLDRTARAALRECDRFVVQRGAGDIALYNAGAEQARGDVVVLTELHCLPDPDLVRSVLTFFARPERDAGWLTARPVGSSALARMEAWQREESAHSVPLAQRWRRASLRGLALRREVWNSLGGLDPELCRFAEADLAMRLLASRFDLDEVCPALLAHVDCSSLRELRTALRDHGFGQARYRLRSEHGRAPAVLAPLAEWSNRAALDPGVARLLCSTILARVRSTPERAPAERRPAERVLAERVPAERVPEEHGDPPLPARRRVIDEPSLLPALLAAAGPALGGPRWGVAIARLRSLGHAARFRWLCWRHGVPGNGSPPRDEILRRAYIALWTSLLREGVLSCIASSPDTLAGPLIEPGHSGVEHIADGALVGFHDLERWETAAIRWSEPIAALRLALAPGPWRVTLDLRSPAPLASRDFQLRVNHHWLPRAALEIGDPSVAFTIPPSLRRPGAEQDVFLCCEEFRPSAVGLPDMRRLGVALVSVRIERPEAEPDLG